MRSADLILVLRDGEIVEQRQLRRADAPSGGVFAELYNTQFLDAPDPGQAA